MRRGYRPKSREARLEPDDLDRRALALLPRLALQAELRLAHRDATRRGDALAGRDVAEFLRDASRGDVPVECSRRGDVAAEAAEEQLENRRPHLRPEAAALEALPEPGAGLGRAGRGEVLGVDPLRSHRFCSRPHAEQQVPVSGPPVLAQLQVERDEVVDEAWRADPVRPRDEERHLVGRVDTQLGHVRELDQLGLRRQPKLEPARQEAKPAERLQIGAAPGGSVHVLGARMCG